jgi:HEAT repeat protein
MVETGGVAIKRFIILILMLLMSIFTVGSASEDVDYIQVIKDVELDIETRREAIKSFAQSTDTSAVIPLISALEDENCYIRGDAAWALGEIGDDRAVQRLIEHLSEQHWVVRGICAQALGKIGDPKAVEPLISILGSRQSWFTERFTTWSGQRWNAAWALGEIGDPVVVEPLIEALGDPSVRIRTNAVEALGKIGDLRATDPLEKTAKKDSNKKVRQAARQALDAIEG